MTGGKCGGADDMTGEVGGDEDVGSSCIAGRKGDVDTDAVDDDDDRGGMIDEELGGVRCCCEGSDDPVKLSNFFWLLFSVSLRCSCCLVGPPFLFLHCSFSVFSALKNDIAASYYWKACVSVF